MPTKVDCINTKEPETLGTCLLAVLSRTVNRKGWGAFDKPELGGKEDFTTLPGAFEPFVQ